MKSLANLVARDLRAVINSRNVRTLFGLCLFEVAYYFAYRYGMSFGKDSASPFWFPDSVLLCALLLSAPGRWWIFVLATLPIRLFVGVPPDVPQWFLLATFSIDSAKGLFGATILRRLIKNPVRLETVREFAVFCLFAVFLIPFVSAFGGAALRYSLGYAFWPAWEQWFMGDALTQLVVTPAIFYLVIGYPWAMPAPTAKRAVEGGLLTAGLILTGYIAFNTSLGGGGFAEPRFYAPVPFLFWAAIRFGMFGASGAITIITVLSVSAALYDRGPFSGQSPADTALALQEFLLLRAAPLYLVAILIEQKKKDEYSLRELREDEKRFQQSLGESEGRFQTMADAAPVLIWVSGEDKLPTYFNKAWLEFTGRSMEQELGNGWKEGVHPDDLAKISQTYGPAVDAREPFVMQYRLKRHDGQYRWITDQAVPRYGPRGNFRGYVGACVDITDLLNKETELREIEERVALAAEAAHVGVWELDTATNELWISDKVRELFHFDRDAEITYAMFHSRVHPEDRSMRDAAIRRAIETKSGYDIEFRLLLPDGAVRWIGGRSRCLDYGDGKSVRLLGVAIDVTKLKEAEELFRLVTEAAPSGILLANAEGRIVLINAHLEELFGYKREELVGQMIEVLIPERFAAEYSALRAAFLARPEERAMGSGRELFGRRKDGTEFPAEIGLNSIRTPQGLLVLASVVDISQRKQAAEELRRHREQINLLSRVSLLGEMTTSLAHELYQPLSAIITNANAGMRSIDKGKEDPGTLREILVDVEADGRRAHDIIRNVRNTIRKSHPTLRRINLNELVTKVAHIVRPDAAAYSCEVETLLAKDLPLIEGDPVQIQQVLVNLVSNALDAMRQTPPDRRKVEISTTGNGDNEVRLSVRDHGTGIHTEVHERLFDRFFTTKEQGLGMGLAIVRSIVESHGGDIQAENVADGGALFFFTLPVKKKT